VPNRRLGLRTGVPTDCGPLGLAVIVAATAVYGMALAPEEKEARASNMNAPRTSRRLN
jgi:hypothetical protein